MGSKTKSATRKKLELRQLEAETVTAELKMEQTRIETEEARHNWSWFTADPEREGRFMFDDAVTETTTARLLGRINKYTRLHPEAPIHITINSPGGSVIPGLALYDELRTVAAQGHHITTQVRGYAASFGVILLQAGDTRLVGQESWLMVHEISAGTGGKLHEIQDEAKFYEALNKRLFAIMANRTGGKYTGASLYRAVKGKDVWICADDAIAKYGLADKIG